MKFVQALGLGVFLVSVSFLVAGGIGTPKKEDIPKYMKQLSAPSATDRAKAAEWMGKRGGINVEGLDDAVPLLSKMLEKDSDAKARAAAARALGAIHLDAEKTVPVMIDRLKTESEVKDVKMAVVVALGQYGPDAKDALPVLRPMLAKFDTKAAKKSNDAMTISTAIQLITMVKKKKG